MFISWFLRSFRAIPLLESEAPELYDILKNISQKARAPAPRLYLTPSASPNAMIFSLGRRAAVLLVTQGLVEKLNREELEGVLAHEIAQLKYGGLRTACLAGLWAASLMLVVSGIRGIFMFSDYRRGDFKGNALVLLVSAAVVPLAALWIRLASFGRREFRADERACEWIENPLYLAGALKKIQAGLDRIPMRGYHPEWAHLFIVSPLRGKGWEAFFKAPPRTEERILRLETIKEPGIRNRY